MTKSQLSSLILLLCTIGLSACGDGDKNNDTGGTDTDTSTDVNPTDTGTESVATTDTGTGTESVATTDTGTEEPADTSCGDTDIGLVTLDLLETKTITVDSNGALHRIDASCQYETGTPGRIVAVTLSASGTLVVRTSKSSECWYPEAAIAIYGASGADAGCASLGDELVCMTSCAANAASATSFPLLQPGTYYVLFADADSSGTPADHTYTLTLSCPPGQHSSEDTCINDTCAEVSAFCAALNKSCDDTVSPAICGDCLDGYAPYQERCILAGATFGGECQKAADCPGTGVPNESVFCYTSTGGYCRAIDVPECVVDGEPCTGDAESICLHNLSGSSFCLKGCEADDDCRAGYYCEEEVAGSAYKACTPIVDCVQSGCNDPDGKLYCGDDIIYDMCWIDACAPDNPCISLDHSDGTCANVRDTYSCGCDAGYLWNAETKGCELFTCDATVLGVFDGTPLAAYGDSCAGSSHYGSSGVGCLDTTSVPSGQEQLFRVAVPGLATIDLVVTPSPSDDFGLTVYLITRCDDINATTCGVGHGSAVDNSTMTEARTLTYTNESAAQQTVILVVDSFSGCDTFDVVISQGCGPGTHHGAGGECVPDACADIAQACAAINKSCDDSVIPAICGGCLPGYEPYADRCILAGAKYGGPCQKHADCPGTGRLGIETFCYFSPPANIATGGYCFAMYTPECAANGAPCTDDPTSVCVISTEGNYKFCGGACEVDADCRPGWFCKADDFYSGVSACEAIEDCLTYGCNDPEGKLACVPDFFGSKCWLDACKNDPCAGIAHADGTCANMWDTYDCGCVEGYGWNSSAKTCDIST